MTTSIARFPAMGSFAEILVLDGNDALLRLAQRRIEHLEQAWSRFRADSEVSAVNAQPGTPVAVGADTLLLASRAVEAYRITGGRFDPSLLPTLRSLGYDRTFEEIGDTPDGPIHAARGGGLVVDLVGSTVLVQPGTGFDPGGLGKGLAADLVADELVRGGARGALVNLGGDLRAVGDAPDDLGWIVSVEDPFDDAIRADLSIMSGAVATTTSARRTWMRGNSRVHHVLDPRTSRPAAAGLVQVTVVADRGWYAEACAKALFVEGRTWRRLAADLGVDALVVTARGDLEASVGILEAA